MKNADDYTFTIIYVGNDVHYKYQLSIECLKNRGLYEKILEAIEVMESDNFECTVGEFESILIEKRAFPKDPNYYGM